MTGQIKALLFDVFGTVVDWRGGVIRDVTAVAGPHHRDLRAAASFGLATAFVPRPYEYGPAAPAGTEPAARYTLAVTGIPALATALAT